MSAVFVKRLLFGQMLVLFAGTIFAWSKLIPQFINFHALYGTFFKFAGCAVPNPLLTACFYGSTAFLIALYWSTRLYLRPQGVSESRLRNFLLFCAVFAASVVVSEAVEYYKVFPTSTISVTCSPGVFPLQTPCFYGMLFFIVAFVISIFATRHLKASSA